jgi:hypothetical protein
MLLIRFLNPHRIVLIVLCMTCLLWEAESVPLLGGGLRPIIPPVLSIRGSDNRLQVIQRLPSATFDSYVYALDIFKDNIITFFPAFAVWKFGLLLTHGWKHWLGEAMKTALEWGVFSATYSGGERFVTRIRAVDDKFNQYIACGICSGLHRASEGLPAVAHGFVTGFAFVYVLEHLTNRLAEQDGGVDAQGNSKSSGGHGRSALEGTLAASGRSRMKSAPMKGSVLSKVTAPMVPKVVTAFPRVGLPAAAAAAAAAASTRRSYAGGYYEFTKR